jgi:hypothetical protein
LVSHEKKLQIRIEKDEKSFFLLKGKTELNQIVVVEGPEEVEVSRLERGDADQRMIRKKVISS